jgi:hypothetical protein
VHGDATGGDEVATVRTEMEEEEAGMGGVAVIGSGEDVMGIHGEEEAAGEEGVEASVADRFCSWMKINVVESDMRD